MGPVKKEVLLVSPLTRIFNHYRPPLALMYISGYLKKNGINSRIIDVVQKDQVRDKKFYRNIERYRNEAEKQILQTIQAADADIVGITCYTPELDEVEQLAKKIKEVRPDIKIVVGGTHSTLYPEHFFDPPSVFDFAVIGEGELAMLDLVNAVRGKKDRFDLIAGIAFRGTDGRVVLTGRRQLADNLDDVACPDYEHLDMTYYTTASPYSVRGVFSRSFYVSSSRGCPSSCTFCVSKKLRDYHGSRGYARLRTPESLFREISELRNNYAIDSFYFVDDLFTLKKDNVIAFCERIMRDRLPLVWGCSSKVNTVDDEMLKCMSMAGCMQIDFGVEKGSDRALAAIKKGITVTQIKKTFELCRKQKIRTFANILINTPGETEEDLFDILRLLDEIKPTVVSPNIFTPYPGCEIFDGMENKITRAEYAELMRDPSELVKEMPDKYRFALHNVDIGKWCRDVLVKYNRILPNAAVFFDGRYLTALIRSRRKIDYLRQLSGLAKEYINQKTANT